MNAFDLDTEKWSVGVGQTIYKISLNNVFGQTEIDVFNTLLGSNKINNNIWAAFKDISPETRIASFGPPPWEPKSAEAFPNRATDPYHIQAVNSLAAMTGLPFDLISDRNPGLGYTGSESTILFRTSDPSLAKLTIIHDLTSSIMLQIKYALENDKEFSDKWRNKLAGLDMNEDLFGAPTIEASAITMALGALGQRLYDGVIPDRDEIFNFLGKSSSAESILALTSAKDNDLKFYYTVTKLGDSAGQLASTLAIYYGDKDKAVNVVTKSFSNTIGGFVGDNIVLNFTNSDINTYAF